MKTITWKEAVATMNGMAFILANLSAKLEIEVESIPDFLEKLKMVSCMEEEQAMIKDPQWRLSTL